MKITIPEPSLVALVGVTGSGKSSFARRHFKPTEVVSSDACRGLVSNDENDQAATKDAFELLHFIVRKRLAAGRLTVVDATNVQAEAREPIVALAREYHCLPVAIVLNLPERLCHERNRSRPERSFGPHVVRQHAQALRRSLRQLRGEGFRQVVVLSSPEEVDAVEIERQPLWSDLRHEHGPFDIIGDVHGCLAELRLLLDGLGYLEQASVNGGEPAYRHPMGRKAVFLGDLVDRGPDTPGVLRLVMAMVAAGSALCLPGNHDVKLMRKLRGRNVEVAHGLAESLAQLAGEPEEFRQRVAAFIDARVSHYVLDDGKLVVAHGGMKESMQGRASAAVRDFALYGETTGESDEYGRPIRYNWAADYRGAATVVYGHTPVPAADWLNNTICIDTGCVFGGWLTALRYPEREPVSVPAARSYWIPARRLPVPETRALSAQQQQDELLDLDDVLGKHVVTTRLLRNVTIRAANAVSALEVMSRFAADPKWLIYLPPTMSPAETSPLPEGLEHPAEAFAYYRARGVAKVVCEEKHMGSRVVVVICRDEDAARSRFGVVGQGNGIVFTRTGRRFFADPGLEAALLRRLGTALSECGLWDELATDWFCLDSELLPWSAKALELVKGQYASVGAAAQAALGDAVALLTTTAARNDEAAALLERYRARAARVASYVEAYRRYCWPVGSLADLKLAPFHLLASASGVHAANDHVWHMETLARLCRASPGLLLATPYRVVDMADAASRDAAIAWWQELTGQGGEGVVVKPLDFVARDRRGLVQPALKIRGREYLRIIYGPEYDLPENLERLRARSVGQALAGVARVRPRHRGPGALRAARAAAPGPRVRLRGPRARKRTRRPEVVAALVTGSAFVTAAQVPGYWEKAAPRSGRARRRGMILVTGASGTVGREVVKALSGRGVPLRAGYRSRQQNVASGVESVALDYEKPETIPPALAGVETLFLLSNTVEPEKQVVNAARRAGVRRIVKLSVFGAAEEAYSFARWHRAVEKQIEASGLAWTFLRPNGYMQNLANYMVGTIRGQSAIYSSAGRGAVSHIDVRDIGAAAARVLSESGHDSQAYELSGPAALRYDEIAAVLSRVLGRAIQYRAVTHEEARQGAIGAGAPEAYAEALVDLNRHYAEGRASRVTDAVRRLTGNDPIPFARFAEDYVAELR